MPEVKRNRCQIVFIGQLTTFLWTRAGLVEPRRRNNSTKPPKTVAALSPVLEAFERNNLGAASGVGNEEADIVVLSERRTYGSV